MEKHRAEYTFGSSLAARATLSEPTTSLSTMLSAHLPPQLQALQQSYSASGHYPRQPLSQIPFPMGLEQVEMLEAELLNQRILRAKENEARIVSHRALHNMAYWQWKAERHGVKSSALSFAIDLPKFIIRRAHELLHIEDDLSREEEYLRASHQHTQGKSLRVKASIELAYVEQVAQYLNGCFEQANNRYEQGLKVVLYAISATPIQDSQKTLLTLPLTTQEFTTTLQSTD